MRDAVGKFEFAVTGEAIGYQRKSLVAFDITGAFEEFVQDSANKI